jgi:hypothetical protein
MHLTLNGCVVTQSLIRINFITLRCITIRFKMLTYYVYAPLLNRIAALPLNVSYYF